MHASWVLICEQHTDICEQHTYIGATATLSPAMKLYTVF